MTVNSQGGPPPGHNIAPFSPRRVTRKAPRGTQAVLAVGKAIGGALPPRQALTLAMRALASAFGATSAVLWRVESLHTLQSLACYRCPKKLTTLRLESGELPTSTISVPRGSAAGSLERTDAELLRVLHTLLPNRTIVLCPVRVDALALYVCGLVWADETHAPTSDDVVSLEVAARQLAATLAFTEVSASLRAARAETRSLRREMEQILERERTRLARELHDELGQALTALKLDIARLATRPDLGTARAPLAVLSTAVDDMVHSVRRIASELRPYVLDELGLPAALEWQIRTFATRTGIACKYKCHGSAARLNADVSTAVFRSLQEILTNIARHADASSVASRVTFARTAVTLEVQDDGLGITPAAKRSAHGLGLRHMRDRAIALEGSVEITRAHTTGTRVRVWIPLGGRSNERG